MAFCALEQSTPAHAESAPNGSLAAFEDPKEILEWQGPLGPKGGEGPKSVSTRGGGWQECRYVRSRTGASLVR